MKNDLASIFFNNLIFRQIKKTVYTDFDFDQINELPFQRWKNILFECNEIFI